jgi:hypothetical protein
MDLPEHIICLHARPDVDGRSHELFINKYILRAYGHYHIPASPPETPSGWTWLAWSSHPGEHGWDAVVTESVEEVTRLLK